MVEKDGYVYHKNLHNTLYTFWRCAEYKKRNCPGRCKTTQNEIFITQEHSHGPNVSNVKTLEVLSQIRITARTTQQTNQQIISQVTGNLLEAVIGGLPPLRNITHTIQYTRRLERAPLPLPQTFNQLIIPDQYKMTVSGERFLLVDSNAAGARFLLFTTQESLNLLSRSPCWLCDGTFKTCPGIFSQFYTIHCVMNDQVVPLVYGLLPSKSGVIYRSFFSSIRSLNRNLNPSSIMIDFEQASIKALRNCFPNSTVKSCYFHFMQAFWRKINQHADIRLRYGREENFNLMIKMLPSLAFLPPTDVVIGYRALRAHSFFIDNDTLLQPIFSYFERTYIGQIHDENILTPPLFSIEMWNVYNVTFDNIGRTNNSVEGWHNAFARFVGSSHPNIFIFFEKLKEYESLNRVLITQILVGSMTRQSRRKYRDLNLRIHNLAIGYDLSNKIDYLKRISHNLKF